jgi:hypothetical protein
VNNEIIKQLVEFSNMSGYRWFIYRNSFNSYSRELCVQIAYNVNVELHQAYDITFHAPIHKSRTKALVLLDKWLKGDRTDKLIQELQDTHSEVYSHAYAADGRDYDKFVTAVHAAVSCANAIVSTYYPNSFHNSDANIAYVTANAVNYAYESVNVAKNIGAYGVPHSDLMKNIDYIDVHKIVIKTVCDYYKIDFETFNALYL